MTTGEFAAGETVSRLSRDEPSTKEDGNEEMPLLSLASLHLMNSRCAPCRGVDFLWRRREPRRRGRIHQEGSTCIGRKTCLTDILCSLLFVSSYRSSVVIAYYIMTWFSMCIQWLWPWNVSWRRSFLLTCSCNGLSGSTFFCLPVREEGWLCQVV